VTKRLQSELMSLMMSGDSDCTAFPEGDNLFNWVGTINGSKDTVYEGLTYKVSGVKMIHTDDTSFAAHESLIPPQFFCPSLHFFLLFAVRRLCSF